MKLNIPIIAKPAQILTVQLAGQRCRIRIYTKTFGLYFDLYVNDQLLIAGAQARNRVDMVKKSYEGFIGKLYFEDRQGNIDPVYTSLGARHRLIYENNL